MQRKILTIIIFGWLAALTAASAASIDITDFNAAQCRGSAALYPTAISRVATPDSLVPVFINHVGRHGARFPASPKGINALQDAIRHAEEAGTLTPTGKQLKQLATLVASAAAGQWGALDSVGIAEQRGIASRMLRTFPSLFDNGNVEAISSYAPRCIMSMYTFTHQLARLNNKMSITTSSGRQFSYLLRPFDLDAEYKDYRQSDEWQSVLEAFRARVIPLEPLKKALGDISGYTDGEARELAMQQYQLVADAAAAGISDNPDKYFTREEYNRLWQAFNLKQYLLYTANIISTVPADMASPLLRSLITSTDAVTRGDKQMPGVMLRFAHAETLMPLLSLMKLKGCNYVTNYIETVPRHWQDFNIVPMAANLQLILFKHKSKDRYYLRVDLNERPLALLPGSQAIYTPWDRARAYLENCIPIYSRD